MVYNSIRSAAFAPVPGAEPFTGFYYALAFPKHWRQAILDLYRHGKRNPDTRKQVPIRSLNATIRALAPDLVSVAEKATLDDDKPWLYTTREYPVGVLKSLIGSWLYTLQPSPEAYPLLSETMRLLELESLDWKMMSVDLAEKTHTAGGTAEPASHLYRLLPEVLAARIEKLPPYEYCGEQVTFRRVATELGAELMSWPPCVHQAKPNKKGQVTHPWHFSGTIKITLQTVPFSLIPRVHLHTGIRRWVRGPVWPPDGQTATVYMRTDGPWLAGTEESARFAAARLRVALRRGERKASWAIGGPEGILSRLDMTRDFPTPDVLAEDAEAWLRHRDGVAAAVTHHPAMGYHGVGVGLMPSERQRLTEWAAQAIEPEFKPVADMLRSDRRPAPKPLLKPKKSQPKKDPTPEHLAEVAAENAAINIANAELRRQHLARAIGGAHVFSCHILWQTPEVRDELINAAVKSLNLKAYRVASTPETWIWRAPEVEVRIHARDLGALGGPLGAGSPPKRGKETQAAIASRRREVQEFLESLLEPSQIVFVELEGKEAFKMRTTDPKFAIRLGCADAGRVSQFIQPERQADGDITGAAEDEGDEEDIEPALVHRAAAAWGDGLRQVGMAFVPKHSLGRDAIPERLNQVAFWIVRRNSDSPTKNRQFTPIAVLIRPDQDCIMGRVPGMQAWMPYQELLRGLTGQIRSAELRTAEQQERETGRFIRQVLYTLRGEPTIVFTHAQNARHSWTWLQNSQLIPDKMQLGDGPVQELALHGKHLRLIRVRDDERNETGQWWAPDDDEHAGQAKGLWVPPGADEGNRVFSATSAKGGSHKKKLRDDTKLTPHINPRTGKPVINSGRNAWNPTLLEIAITGCTPEDKPDAWAMYAQQQRIVDDYRDGLKFPLVLHLAGLATEYALPHEFKVLDDSTTPDESDDLD